MSDTRYSLPAVLLHWVQAILVVWLLWLGWTMTELPKGPARGAAYGLHKSLGLLVLCLTFARLAWRWHCPPPPAAGDLRSQALARRVHQLLYGFLLLAPLCGYLTSAFTANPVKFFGLELPRLFAPDEGLNAQIKQLHLFFVWSGAGLIVLHLAGALRHALAGERLIARMLPFGPFRK